MFFDNKETVIDIAFPNFRWTGGSSDSSIISMQRFAATLFVEDCRLAIDRDFELF